MKTLADLRKEHATNCVESLLECKTFDKKEMTAIVDMHMSMMTADVAKHKIIKYDNTLKQLTENLNRPGISESDKVRFQGKINELNVLANKSHILITENAREHKYRKMRRFLEDNGLKSLLEEFDKLNPTEDWK